MSTTIKDSDASDATFVTVGFSGLNQMAREIGNTATFVRSLDLKHTLAAGNIPGRHLISVKSRRYDATTGKWGEGVTNITAVRDASGIVTLDDMEDNLAIAVNYLTGNVAAMTGTFTTNLQRFLDGVSPI